VSSLHPARFAVGSAVNQTARQIGGAVGIALLVVILGTPSSAAAALNAFHHLWLYGAVMATASGLVSAFLRPAGAVTQSVSNVAPEPMRAIETPRLASLRLEEIA